MFVGQALLRLTENPLRDLAHLRDEARDLFR